MRIQNSKKYEAVKIVIFQWIFSSQSAKDWEE